MHRLTPNNPHKGTVVIVQAQGPEQRLDRDAQWLALNGYRVLVLGYGVDHGPQ